MTPTHSIILTTPAFDEIDIIIGILRRYSAETAQRWFARFWAVVKSLEWNPERFPIAPEDEHYHVGLRQVVFGKRRSVTRILYRVRGNTVRILRIRYGQRDVIPPGDLDVE
jgi:plasmid stabilization system protein ParE